MPMPFVLKKNLQFHRDFIENDSMLFFCMYLNASMPKLILNTLNMAFIMLEDRGKEFLLKYIQY